MNPVKQVAGRPAARTFRVLTSRFAVCAMAPLLAACAVHAPPAHVAAPVPDQWHAPLPGSLTAPAGSAAPPHEGSLSGLALWWQRQGDPVLARLIESAQAANPTVAAARTRIGQARSAFVTSDAALLPSLDGSVSASRASSQPPTPLASVLQAALQTSWEIDLFGTNRANQRGAQARLEGAQAGWHEARVSVAAETASQYYGLRACEQLLAVTRSDLESRVATARLTDLLADAGFQAPATAALARAGTAEARARSTQQRAQCDANVKALVALTAVAEPELRALMPAQSGEEWAAGVGTVLPDSARRAINSLPARTLAQRPDVFSAEREVAAASADVGSAEAQRYPRLSLSGSVGLAGVRAGGASASLATWSIGPLALSLPLFDGGRRVANVVAAQARYDEAVSRYHASARQAVREVEEALLGLHSTAARSEDARTAVEGYRASFAATEARFKSGFGSVFELEEARRTLLTAETALVSLQRERIAAWIALYRAAGGGWSSAAETP